MKIKEGLSISAMGDNFVVVADDERIFPGMIKLNKSGAFVFELLQKQLSENEIITEIVKKYDVEKKDAERDFYEYMKAFENAGLVENE